MSIAVADPDGGTQPDESWTKTTKPETQSLSQPEREGSQYVGRYQNPPGQEQWQNRIAHKHYHKKDQGFHAVKVDRK